MDTTPENVWEQYGLSEDEWNQLGDAEKDNYLSIGTTENGSDMEEND